MKFFMRNIRMSNLSTQCPMSAAAITEITLNKSLFKARANRNGKILFSLPRPGMTDGEFSDLLFKNHERRGELACCIVKARADGIVTKGEYVCIHQHIRKSIEELLQLDLELKSQVRNLK